MENSPGESLARERSSTTFLKGTCVTSLFREVSQTSSVPLEVECSRYKLVAGMWNKTSTFGPDALKSTNSKFLF